MPIEVQLPDGSIAEFPDGMDASQIEQVLAKQFGAPQPISPQVQAISGAFQDPAQLAGVNQRFQDFTAQGLDEKNALRMAIENPPSAADQKSFIKGAIPAAATLISGAVAEPIAGIAGVVASLTPGLDAGVGARTVERVRGALTIDPITEDSAKVLQGVGGVLDPTLGAIGRGAQSAGEFSADVTGSPLVGTAVETGIQSIPDLLGLKGVKQVAAFNRMQKGNRALFDQATGLPSPPLQKALDKRGMDFGALIGDGDNLPVIFGDKTPEQVVDTIIRDKLISGDKSNALYNLKLGPKGTVINDALGDEALKQGFLKGDIAAAKTANLPTKREMQSMLKMKRSIQADSSKALDFRPSDVVGNNAMKRFNFVRNRANDLRKELDRVATKELATGKNLLESGETGGLLKGRQVDPSKVADSYFAGLEKLGVEFDTSTAPPRLDFKNSAISEDKTSQRIIKSVTNILAKGGKVDALKAHELKRQLDTMLDFNKKSAAGLTDAGKKFTGNIRKAVNESIRDVSPRYARINDELSKSLDAMQSFDDALGGVDAFADNANVAVGTTLRRLLSNVQSRATLDTALTNLDNTAAALGGNFDTDIKRLIQFNNTLDDRFGATARGSFKGEIESAMRSGPTQAAKDFALKKGAEKIEELRGINESNAFNVMTKILKESAEGEGN